MPVVDPLTGEYMILIKNKKETANINKSKFIKFYFNLINILHLMSTSEIIILQHICKNIGINKLKIKITRTDTELKKTTFHAAINSLIKLNVISRTEYQNIYEINKEMIFNGKY